MIDARFTGGVVAVLFDPETAARAHRRESVRPSRSNSEARRMTVTEIPLLVKLMCVLCVTATLSIAVQCYAASAITWGLPRR